MATVNVNGVDYATYSSLELASDYLAVSLSAIRWNAGDEDFRSKVMVLASRYLDSIKWKGTKVVADQPNEWPRMDTGVASAPVDNSTPQAILNGFYELCALIAEDPGILQAANSGSNVQRAKGGEAEVWFFKSTLESATRLQPIVHNWVKDYYASAIGVFSFASGVPEEPFVSVFDETPDRVEGLF